MKFLKLQTEILKDWFNYKTKDTAPKWKACKYKDDFYVTDNKVLVCIPKYFFILNVDEDTPKLSETSVEKFTKEPSDFEVFEKTTRIETFSDCLATVYEPKQGDRKSVLLNKNYLNFFESDCIVKGTRPDYPVYIYETNLANEEIFRGILMPVVK